MKDKYEALEVSILFTYLYKSLILINGINLILYLSKLNTIISVIIGILLGFIILNLYLKANDILPKYNIFEKIDYLYNKIISIIIKLILIISIIIFTTYLLKVTISFIKFNYVDNLTTEVINILYIISIIYLVNKDLKTIIKVSTISISIVVILDIISIIFSMGNINSSNLLPLVTNNFGSTLQSGINYLILSTIPLFLLLIIPKNSINQNRKYKRYIKITYIIMSVYIIFNLIFLLSIMNINLIELIPYPFVFILSKINILNFFDRMENLLSYKFLFDSFITLTLSFYYIKSGITTFIKSNKNNKYITYIIGLLIYILNLIFTINIKYILIILIIFLLSNLSIILSKKQ